VLELGLFWLFCWVVKNAAEDVWSMSKGQSNPRMDRRRARQKARAGNPIWQQLTGWAGDITADAREEAAHRRQVKKEKRRDAEAAERAAEQRRRDEQEQIVDAEIIDDEQPGPTSPTPEEKAHEDMNADECSYDWCPVHHPQEQAQPERTPDNQPDPSTTSTEGDTMSDISTEIQGLDQAIAYAEGVEGMAANHAAAGNEGYIGHLTASKVTGQALQSAHDMQEAFGNARAAAENHKNQLLAQKAVQEAFDANPDAGDKEFQTAPFRGGSRDHHRHRSPPHRWPAHSAVPRGRAGARARAAQTLDCDGPDPARRVR
jgi:hypothetical protein